MAIRSSPCRQVENPATVPPPKPVQLGKTQSNIVVSGIGVAGERALTLVPSPGYRRRAGVLRCCRHLFWPPRQARSERRTLERARTLLDGGQVRCCAQSCTGTNCCRTISRAWTFEVRPGFWAVPEVHRKHEPSAWPAPATRAAGRRGCEGGLELRPLQACSGRGAHSSSTLPAEFSESVTIWVVLQMISPNGIEDSRERRAEGHTGTEPSKVGTNPARQFRKWRHETRNTAARPEAAPRRSRPRQVGSTERGRIGSPGARTQIQRSRLPA